MPGTDITPRRRMSCAPSRSRKPKRWPTFAIARRRRASRSMKSRWAPRQRGVTELRPGNYVYFDRTQVALGAATFDDCALTVLAMVVSKPAKDRIVLDSGSKTLTSDQARGITTMPGFG